jgi:hypothetical protein
MHSLVTYQSRELTLQDVAGLPVGHIPRDLAGSFRAIMDDGGSICAEATGEPISSFPPWSAPMSKGGGVVVPCNYIFHYCDESFMLRSLKCALRYLHCVTQQGN